MLSRSVLRLVQLNSNETLFATASVRQTLLDTETHGSPGASWNRIYFANIVCFLPYVHSSYESNPQVPWNSLQWDVLSSHMPPSCSICVSQLQLAWGELQGGIRVAGMAGAWQGQSPDIWNFLGILASKYRRNVRTCHEMLDVTSGCEDMGYGEMWWHDSHDHQNKSKCKKTIQNISKYYKVGIGSNHAQFINVRQKGT